MALKKISGNPFSNIRTWLFERNKTITPNPLKPLKKKIVTEKEIDANKLQKILIETHGPTGLINKIIDEIKDLIKRVSKLENRMDVAEKDIDKLENRMDSAESDINKNTSDIRNLDRYDQNFGNKYTREQQQQDTQFNRFTNVTYRQDQVKNQADRTSNKTLAASKSTIGHTHVTTSGTAFPSIGKRGGSIKKLQSGGRTIPKSTNRKDFKQMLIKDILELQKSNG